MPERQDTENTTDQARSGGKQTQESNRPGQGGSDGTAARVAPENARADAGGDDRLTDEMQRREIARDSKHSGNHAEEWSPGTHHPNT